jgi:hypothetical protein
MPVTGIIAKTFYSEERMESPQPVIDAPVRKNRTPYTIALAALVLCCCCSALIIAGYYYYRQNILTVPTLPTEGATPVPVPTDASIFPTSAPSADIGEAPEGGLGDEILRNDTWQYVAFAAIGQGCDRPIGEDTEIEVLQQPENDVWVEKWTVVCASGESYPYEIEYILDPSGTGATFNVKSIPE